ncbi:spaetzle domain-containing protein 6 isoform X1 [Choristoneura fumiferana]|uniref:spaetzle domain-containing protein 6 isoform X1 n=1 Tax=Choristoneura fumiferana TaxID=7141 RepID=UPI003D157C02
MTRQHLVCLALLLLAPLALPEPTSPAPDAAPAQPRADDDEPPEGYYAFVESPNATPPRVRPPPYRQVAAECPSAAARAHVSAHNLCGDLNRGLIPRNPMGQNPNGEPYPFELLRNHTLRFLSRTLPVLRADDTLPRVAHVSHANPPHAQHATHAHLAQQDTNSLEERMKRSVSEALSGAVPDGRGGAPCRTGGAPCRTGQAPRWRPSTAPRRQERAASSATAAAYFACCTAPSTARAALPASSGARTPGPRRMRPRRPRSVMRARRRRARRAWSTRRRCSRATTRACGATSCRYPTRGISRRLSRSPDACSPAATTWMAAACRPRAGCPCWWESCTTPRPPPPHPPPEPPPRPRSKRDPTMTNSTRSISSICKSAPGRRPTHRAPRPTSPHTAMVTTRWAASRCGCTTTGSWCRARASVGGPTTSRATCAAATPGNSKCPAHFPAQATTSLTLIAQNVHPGNMNFLVKTCQAQEDLFSSDEELCL